MLKFAPATAEQYDQFLQMMWEDGQEYLRECNAHHADDLGGIRPDFPHAG